MVEERTDSDGQTMRRETQEARYVVGFPLSSAARLRTPASWFDRQYHSVPRRPPAGATWDKGTDARARQRHGQGVSWEGVLNIALSPTVGPLAETTGRTQLEGFGADPVLQAVGGAQTITGIQSHGAIATIKHLIANEQEMYRMYSALQPGYSSAE